MSNATLASSPDDELYDLREQVLAAQRLFERFFEEENWIWAYKALAYAGRLARRLPDAINPFVEAGRPFASMPEREPPPAPEITDADIALHAMVTKTYAEINEEREANGWKPVGFAAILKTTARHYGVVAALRVAAVENRRRAPENDSG
jgi:hypothetical protein